MALSTHNLSLLRPEFEVVYVAIVNSEKCPRWDHIEEKLKLTESFES